MLPQIPPLLEWREWLGNKLVPFTSRVIPYLDLSGKNVACRKSIVDTKSK
jgi:hypothetical protein